jgi:hypothetical protein
MEEDRIFFAVSVTGRIIREVYKDVQNHFFKAKSAHRISRCALQETCGFRGLSKGVEVIDGIFSES